MLNLPKIYRNGVPKNMPHSIFLFNVGDCFEFSGKKLSVGDEITFAHNYDPYKKDTRPKFGKAKVISVVAKNYYRAQVVRA